MKKKTIIAILFSLVVLISVSAFARDHDVGEGMGYSGREAEIFDEGYDLGYSVGRNDGVKQGKNDADTLSYNRGYNEGFNKGLETNQSSLDAQLEAANAHYKNYKNATIVLASILIILILSTIGYFSFVYRKKKPAISKTEAKTTEIPIDIAKSFSSELTAPSIIKPARIVKVRAVKKAPVSAVPPIRPTIPVATPEPEQASPISSPAESNPPIKPKAAKPDPSEEVHKRAKDLGLGMKWFDFLRSHFWGPALTFAAINALGILSLTGAMAGSSVRILSIVPFALYLSNILLYVNLFNSLIACSYLVPTKWNVFCSFNLIVVMINFFIMMSNFSLNNFTYFNIIGMVLTAIAFIPNIIYFGKRKKLFD